MATHVSPSPGRRIRPSQPSAASREKWWGFLFISPWIIGFLAFSLFPSVSVLVLGLTEYDLFSKPYWIGLENYERMFAADPTFWKSVANTMYYVLSAVPLRLALAFMLAWMLARQQRGANLFRVLLYLPSVVPFVAMSIIWMWILHPSLGVLNYLLALIGIPGPNWLGSVQWSKPAIILLSLWRIGTLMVVFLANFRGIPQMVYDAASVDGASTFRQLWSITIPLMTPAILFNLVMDLIHSFQVFAPAFIMTNGGPVQSSTFLVLYIYQAAFRYFEMGYAAALSTVLFIAILILTWILMKTSRGWVQYSRF